MTLCSQVFIADCETLRAAAARHGLLFGSAAAQGHLQEPTYKRILGEQYSLITAENACKWSGTHPQRGQYNFGGCDAVANFARSNNQTFRGHNLCWGEYNPSWLENGHFSANEKRSILEDHINQVVKHYGNTAYGWDVVNEAIKDSGDGFKQNVWYPDVPDYIDVAFKAARTAAPNGVKLFYNDYNIGSSTGWSQKKSQKAYDMVKSMKQRGIPIDGVGLQLHIDLNYNLISGVKQNIERYAALGLEVHITELDIKCGNPCNTQQQATAYHDLLQVCVQSSACKNFETWGFTDKYTWIGSDQHPLPFDENYNSKPAVQSMLNALQ